jgi:hypothetical protein
VARLRGAALLATLIAVAVILSPSVATAAAPIAQTGTAVSISSTTAELRGNVDPQGEDTTYHVEYGTTTAYGTSTPIRTTGAGTVSQFVAEPVTGLTPSTTYHFRVVATNPSGTSNGTDQVFFTQAGTTGTGTPQFAREVGAGTVSGTVRVRVPGSNAFAVLGPADQIPVGSVVDTRGGRVRITIADRTGKLWSTDFYEGLFKVTQPRRLKGIAEMVLVGENRKICGRTGARAAGKPRGKSVAHLWGSGSGPFRTKGKYASSAIRGTTWNTDDRCNGTLVTVTEGSVTVRDFVKKKNVVVFAGKQYFARARGR